MSAPPMDSPVVDALTRLEAGLDALGDASFDSCSDSELLDVWKRLEAVRRRLEPVDHAVIAEAENRSLAATYGCSTTAALARHVLRLHPAEAAARVAAARELGPGRALSGEPLPPKFARAAAGQADGTLSARHARVITETIATLSDPIAAEAGEWVEATLVGMALELDPLLLARHAHTLAYRLDQDGSYRDADHRERRRELHLRRRSDGSGRLEGELTAECAEYLATQLDALGAPASGDGLPDPRTPGQRRHDALRDLCTAALRARQLPASAGCAATIVLHMDADAYATGLGMATTGHGYPVRADLAKTWAGPEARIIAVLLSRTKGITAYSSTQRIFTEQQRLALIARDKGCSFPGCDAPPQYCEVHHVTEFRQSRRTSVEDAALVCSYHHRHHEQLGWTCHMTNGGPTWVPPEWLDPDRVPRRNRMHDNGTESG